MGPFYVTELPTATMQELVKVSVAAWENFKWFGTFAYADRLGLINAASATFTGGTISGKRYDVRSNAVINTNGGGENFFAGDSAGSYDARGQYL